MPRKPPLVKIAMVTGHANPLAAPGSVGADGQSLHIAELASALVEQGHDVSVYARRAGPGTPDHVRSSSGYDVVYLPTGPAQPIERDGLVPYLPELTGQLAERWSRDLPDVVHAHFWMSGMASLGATRELDVPVVQTFHALGVVEQRHQPGRPENPPGRERAEQAIGRSVARTLATCTEQAYELVRMGVPRTAVAVIPSGVDLHSFHPDAAIKARDRPRIVAAGRLIARKGFDQLIRALRGIPDAELVIAGGPPADALNRDSEARRLLALAKRLQVRDRVRLLGAVSREHMPDLLRSADVVACAPWYEPFGLVPLEAMACGVPVVGTAVGGLTDTIVDEVTGLLVPPHQPLALAHAVTRLLADPVLRDSMGMAGADRARARYSWSRVATDVARTYDSVRGEGRHAAAEAQ